MSRFKTFDSIEGKVLCSTTVRGAMSESERKHLVKMNSGEWALVESWITYTGDFGSPERVYSINNRIGSCSTEQALARWDLFKTTL